jgi:hypothetical protein
VLNLVGTKSNRSAVGARVEVVAGNLKQIDEVRAGSSYASMHPLELEFGLARQTQIDKINVYWPSGVTQTLTNVGVNQILKITEPAGTTGVTSNSPNQPGKFSLLQNFPNPFNPETAIRYQLDKAGEVFLKIVNLSGQIIQAFDLGLQGAGEYAIKWDGKNQEGVHAPSGVYFYQIAVKSENGVLRSEVKKMVLLE